jgi:TetR/AcrR family transcriptional regulator
VDAAVRAGVLTAFAVGRLQRFARSGFRRPPTEQLEASLRMVLSGA